MTLLLVKVIVVLITVLLGLVTWIGRRLFDHVENLNTILHDFNLKFNSRLIKIETEIAIWKKRCHKD